MSKNITISILSVVIIFALGNIMYLQNIIKNSNNSDKSSQLSSFQVTNKTMIGDLVLAELENGLITYESRVDTGAQTTSIHAVNIQIVNQSSTGKKNIGKEITFELVNNLGETESITKKIIDVRTVKNSEKKESRYYVNMKITVEGKMKDVLVNLNDRDDMNYKLLIGRNYLQNDFLIDIN